MAIALVVNNTQDYSIQYVKIESVAIMSPEKTHPWICHALVNHNDSNIVLRGKAIKAARLHAQIRNRVRNRVEPSGPPSAPCVSPELSVIVAVAVAGPSPV